MEKELKGLIRENCRRLENSEQTFFHIYQCMFQQKERILGEYTQDYRICRWSYGKTQKKIEETARSLYARIGGNNAYVGLEMENCMEWIIGFWGILRSGNRPYLVNCRHPHSLSNRILKDLKIRYVLTLEPSELEAESLLFSELEPAETEPPFFADEIAFSTSATTMNEVVCFYTGREISAQLLNVKGILAQCPEMAGHYHGELKQLAFLPFYHVFGLIAVYFWFTFFGRTLVFLQDYAPETILKTCRKHEVTHIFAVPMLWHTIEKQVWRRVKEQGEKKEQALRRGLKLCTALQNLMPHFGAVLSKRILGELTRELFGPSVKFCISGGSYLRGSALELINGLGYSLHNGYGMSEIGITSVELRNRPKYRNRNSIGRPFDSVEYRIDPEGSLQVRGSSICKRKLVNGRELCCEEWMNTGDLMEQREEDYYILGRRGDMVLGENGENINPDEIEMLLNPTEALSFSVLGLPHGENQELSMILQISPFLSQSRIDTMLEQLYGENEALPDAARVRKFYLTYDALASKTAIKVSRPYLQRGIDQGTIRLMTRAELKGSRREAEAATDNPELYRKVRGIVAKVLDLPEEKIEADAHLIFDLGVSSLQYFEILSTLAEEFSVSVPSDGEKQRYTLREFCQYIERHM